MSGSEHFSHEETDTLIKIALPGYFDALGSVLAKPLRSIFPQPLGFLSELI